MADEKVKVTCAKCGKEFEADARLANWMERNPDKKFCPDCFAANKKGGTTKAKPSGDTESKAASSGKFGSKSGASEKLLIEPKHFIKILDEFRAELGDDFDVAVKAGAIGGWVTTVLLARRDKGMLK